MYNRYVPQADGSFHRSRVPDAPPLNEDTPKEAPTETIPQTSAPPPPRQEVQGQRYPAQQSRRTNQRYTPNRNTQNSSISDFLKKLLPQNFDTEDFIVVLLLLLMSGDRQEDQNIAMLTLAIYLFL